MLAEEVDLATVFFFRFVFLGFLVCGTGVEAPDGVGR